MGCFVRLIAVVSALVLAFGVAGARAETAPTPAAAEAPAAEAPNRADYVSELEKVCRPGSEETQRAMKNVRHDVRDGRIPLAAYKFGRGATIFGRTIKTIARFPRPSGDLAKLKEWFVYLNRQEDYLNRITAQLHAGRTVKAQRLTAHFIHNGNLANNVVLAFGFNYCSFKFIRYGF